MNLEEKRARFKRLASERTNAVIHKLKVLGNCSNKSAYAYTDEEINKIFGELERALRVTKSKFHTIKPRKFSL